MKRLVFSFYVTNDYKDIETNKLHFDCLKYYKDIFDACSICLIVDESTDSKVIASVKTEFMDIFQQTNDLTFKIYKNSEFRESIVFYNEVYKNLKDDGLVFFGHNKGITNIEKYDRTVIKKWIAGMYYYNLNFIDEVDDMLYNRKFISYGAFLCDNKEVERKGLTKYGWYYVGTFFWINSKKLLNYIQTNEIFTPELSDRFFDEDFLGNIYDREELAASHGLSYLINATDFYHNADLYIDLIYKEDSFNEFYNNIIKKTDIQVVYMATNGYINYIWTFLDSIKYFIPGLSKRITILTNEKIDLSGYLCGDIKYIDIVNTFDMLYPTMNINKTHFIRQIINDDCRYLFYFDADTVFEDVSDYNWDSMISELDSDKVLVTKHPFYALNNGEQFWGSSKEGLIDNFFTPNLTERNDFSSAFIYDYTYTYINSAFFAGCVGIIKQFCERIDDMTKRDLIRYFMPCDINMSYHIPQFIDENYFNRIVNDFEHGECDIEFSIKQYSKLYNKDRTSDTIFISQKNMNDFKYNRQ